MVRCNLMLVTLVFGNPSKLICTPYMLHNCYYLDEADRAALKQMKGKRVGFTEREDAYILMTEIIKDLMRLQDKGKI